MQVKEHYNHWLPPLLKAVGVTLGHHIFYSWDEAKIPDWLRKHEMKHVEQYKKHGVIWFLIQYGVEYMRGRIQGLSHWEAYANISFEIEARKAERQ